MSLKKCRIMAAKDSFICNCGPCRSFYKQAFHDHASLLQRPTIERTVDTSIMLKPVLNKEDHPAVLKIGDRVVVKGKHKGVIKFIGVLNDNVIAPDTYVGVHLDENVHSSTNGIYKGNRYFYCPIGHGAMVKYSDVRLIDGPEKRPSIYGNSMFPSFKEIQRRRKIRKEREENSTNIRWSSYEDRHNSEIKQKEKPTGTCKEEVVKKKIQKAKNPFGTGEKAEKMTKTLKKLQKAYNEGLKLKNDEFSDLTDDETLP